MVWLVLNGRAGELNAEQLKVVPHLRRLVLVGEQRAGLVQDPGLLVIVD